YTFTFGISGNGIVSIPFAETISLGLSIDSGNNDLSYHYATNEGSQWIIELASNETYSMDAEDAIVWNDVLDYDLSTTVIKVAHNGITSFTVNFPAAAETTGYGYAYLLDDDDELVADLAAADFAFNEEKTVATYTFAEPIVEDGFYRVMISDGFFFLNNGETSGISPVLTSVPVMVMYIPEVELDLTVTPAEGEYETIDEITMTIAGDAEFAVNPYGEGNITISKGEDVVLTAAADDIDADGEVAKWTVDLSEAGEYTLTVPARYFYSKAGYSKAVTVTWKVLGKQDGISEITVDADSAVVFDLQGRRMPKAVRGAVNIINGTKVIR
ncbi:MAG: hypothetical protein K2M97_05665, partial [Muribaculaceae bacterium]|nr:hypothetical protein [Muribaculaceae bacterium]